VSSRTSVGVYITDEPGRDHLALTRLLDPPPVRPPPLLPGEEKGDE
jgi:hypothetical protein